VIALLVQIEKANLAELDWALANMGTRRSHKTNKSIVEMIEAGARASKEDVRKFSFVNTHVFMSYIVHVERSKCVLV